MGGGSSGSSSGLRRRHIPSLNPPREQNIAERENGTIDEQNTTETVRPNNTTEVAAAAEISAANPEPEEQQQQQPVPPANQPPPARDPQQFDLFDRIFSFAQILLMVFMLYSKSAGGNYWSFIGYATFFIIFILHKKGFFRPGRRNVNGQNNNNDSENGNNDPAQNANRPPPGFGTVLKNFVFGFFRSLIPEQLPQGAVIE